MTKVSIIVPIHNSAEYLADCLASIERQTLRDIEVLCLDDASTDDSAALCREFSRCDDRFKLVSFPENIGVSATRNKGIELAQGDFLLFMDSDDWYPGDTTVERLYKGAVDHGVAIAGGEMSEVDQNTGKMRIDYTDDPHLQLYNFDKEGVIEYRDWQGDYGFTRFIYERSLINDNNIRFPDLIRHEDPIFFVKAMIAAGRFYAIPEPVYRYRVFHKSYVLSQEAVDDAVEACIELIEIADAHGLKTLRGYVVGTLTWYLTTQAPDVLARIDEVYQSHSYRLGYAMLAPYRALKATVGFIKRAVTGGGNKLD